MKIFTRSEIEQRLCLPEILEAIEMGFVAYSQGKTIIPPIASLHFTHPPGDCHIKYGYSTENPYYVVKIASGFPENPLHGLPSGNGLILLFERQTGCLAAILLDEGLLTEIRTAAAGCIVARSLAPKQISCVGIIGTGAQAYYQLKLLAYATDCRNALIWGRDPRKVQKFLQHSDLTEWSMEVAQTVEQIAAECNLIVTTTSSQKPLLFAEHIRPGTHITAIGADDVGKQELDPHIFAKVDIIAVDSLTQSELFGDVSYALNLGIISKQKLLELGKILSMPSLGRSSDEQITVADLTGVAIQDLQIAISVFEKS